MATQQCCYVTIQNVAVATDFSDCSERAVLHAVGIARKFGATLHLLNLVQPSKFAAVPDMLPEIDKAAGRDCDDLIHRLSNTHLLDGVRCQRWVEQGEIFEVAGEFVKEHHIDLLVLGTHGRKGLSRLLFGSVSQEILQHVACPVVTVGPCSGCPDTQVKLKKILFSTDLSAESLAALPWVLTAVREWKTELDVLHVCTAKDATCPGLLPQRMQELRARIESLQEGYEQLPIRYHQIAGKPAPSIVEFANGNGMDLVILGIKAPHGLYAGSRWSQAYEILREAHCPVLSVRSDLG
jgi:nucleotide-binding universal stress UspA family protein